VGLPVLSGFWSKDDIIAVLSEGIHEGPHQTIFVVLFAVALLTAVLTAFYTFRAYFLTFHGPERFPEEAGAHPHDAPSVMAWPLAILSLFAVGVGIAVGPTGLFAHYLSHTQGLPPAPDHAFHWGIMGISTVAALAGIGVAWAMYKARRPAERPEGAGGPLYALSQNKFYLDEIFAALIVRPLEMLAKLCVVFDLSFLDRLVDAIGELPPRIGRFFRPLQDGLVQSYALLMLIGLTFFLLAAAIL
jgi:NADH-quinone oxidoreductase subunit L